MVGWDADLEGHLPTNVQILGQEDPTLVQELSIHAYLIMCWS